MFLSEARKLLDHLLRQQILLFSDELFARRNVLDFDLYNIKMEVLSTRDNSLVYTGAKKLSCSLYSIVVPGVSERRPELALLDTVLVKWTRCPTQHFPGVVVGVRDDKVMLAFDWSSFIPTSRNVPPELRVMPDMFRYLSQRENMLSETFHIRFPHRITRSHGLPSD